MFVGLFCAARGMVKIDADKVFNDVDQLTIFNTRDVLYHFNAGWLYNMNVDEERRKQVDRELVALRINGTVCYEVSALFIWERFLIGF